MRFWRILRHPIAIGSLIGLGIAAPITWTDQSGVSVANACGEKTGSTTCCRDIMSACTGGGPGWYDTGMCGPCSALHEC